MSLQQQVQQVLQKNQVGQPVKRLEDLKLLRGLGGFLDDSDFADQHYAALLRSPYAHARIKSIDYSAAASMPGVLCILTGKDIARLTKPETVLGKTTTHYIMAYEKVRYMGEPVAAVIANDKYVADDALQHINVEYEPLPSVGDVRKALEPGAPLVYEELGTNLLANDKFEFGDMEEAFRTADATVKETFQIHRYFSTPLEPIVVNASYDRTKDEMTVYTNGARPGIYLAFIERMLGIPHAQVRCVIPISGGGYGNKGSAISQYIGLIAFLSKYSGKPVKWVQTRTEALYGPHRPAGVMEAELALKADGTVLAIRLRDFQGDANWPNLVGIYSMLKFTNMVGPYAIKNLSFEFHSIATNLPPVTPDRGVGKPFMSFVLERMMTLAAKKLKLDQAEFRFRNFIPPEKMPYETPSGEIYESGNYPPTLQKALEVAGYQNWRAKQAELRREGRHIGIGISCGIEPGTCNAGSYYYTGHYTNKPQTDYSEPTGAGEVATVEMDPVGNIKAATSSVEAGQGHATTIAQVVADIFNLQPEEVLADNRFDTMQGYTIYSGYWGNHFHDLNIGAVVKACNALKAKMLRIASHVLHVSQDDLEFGDKRVYDKHNKSKSLRFRDIAQIAYNSFLALPDGEEPGLKFHAGYTNPYAKPAGRHDSLNAQLTHSNAAHVVVTEVDTQTGVVSILRYVIVHDAGRQINPMIVEGMAIGSTASGIGGALLEEFVFDENCNNMCLTFGEYLKPTASDIPEMEIHSFQTPAPNTVLGSKATGEGGALTSLAAVANSVEDALAPFNVKITSLPLTPERVLKLIENV